VEDDVFRVGVVGAGDVVDSVIGGKLVGEN